MSNREHQDAVTAALAYLSARREETRAAARVAGGSPVLDAVLEHAETIGGVRHHLERIYEALREPAAEALPVCAGDGQPPCNCGMTTNPAMTMHTLWCDYDRWSRQRTREAGAPRGPR